jgi:transposase
MTMTIVEAARGVTGGVDTHLDVHVAAALDPLGGLLGTESFSTDLAGYKALLRHAYELAMIAPASG